MAPKFGTTIKKDAMTTRYTLFNVKFSTRFFAVSRGFSWKNHVIPPRKLVENFTLKKLGPNPNFELRRVKPHLRTAMLLFSSNENCHINITRWRLTLRESNI